jgi:hypothetical protein
MKKFLAIFLVVIFSLMLCGCNRQIIDTTYHFNYGIIFLPDGSTIEGEVALWDDYENSDMIQVKIDGVTYLTHSANVILEHR